MGTTAVTKNPSLAETLRAHEYIVPVASPALQPTRMPRAIEVIRKQLADVIPQEPPQFNAREAYLEITATFQRSRSLDLLPPNRRRQAVWMFFTPIEKEPPLGRILGLETAFLDLLESRRRPREIVNLLHQFLLNYPREWPTFEELRARLKELLRQRSGRLLSWKERSEKYSLCEPSGPTHLGILALGVTDDINVTLANAGLTGELAEGRFARETYIALLASMRRLMERGQEDLPTLRRVLSFAEGPGALRYPQHRSGLVNTLLEPFLERSPQPDCQTEIQRFLMRHLGHPAIKTSAWVGVSENARSVMLRWLAGATLEDFFEILDRTAPAWTDDARRWRYRKAFWLAYHRKGYIRDAWIAVGLNAKRVLTRIHDSVQLSYADLEGAGSNDSLLLLRIGTLTIAEWSHVGACRLWKAGNPNKPSLYRHTYKKQETNRLPSEAVVHANAEAYLWQGRVSEYIRGQTGAVISQSDYTVRGANTG